MLEGLRVIEVGQALSAPFAAETLGFLGAEVIKVERPGGDETRRWGEPYDVRGAMLFHMVNRNKKSVTLDLADPAGHAALIDLVATADVFLHNLRPGVAAKLGLDAATLRGRFPALIYGEVGAYGDKGPLKDEAGYEMLMQGFAGIMSVTGETDGRPMRTGPSICDFGSGLWLTLGVLAALYRRRETGLGCTLTTSILESGLFWALIPSGEYVGHGHMPVRAANGHPTLTPYGLFETGDGALIVGSGKDLLFRKLVTALGAPEMADDPRFADNPSRLKHRRVVEGRIAERFLTGTTAHWMETLRRHGVPCAPVQTIPEAIEHPQTAALGILQEGPEIPGLRLIGPPISFDGSRPALRANAPLAGADNRSFNIPEPRE